MDNLRVDYVMSPGRFIEQVEQPLDSRRQGFVSSQNRGEEVVHKLLYRALSREQPCEEYLGDSFVCPLRRLVVRVTVIVRRLHQVVGVQIRA